MEHIIAFHNGRNAAVFYSVMALLAVYAVRHSLNRNAARLRIRKKND